MKINLLDFQSEKSSELVRKTLTAQRILQEDIDQHQAVVLASPTGSGKTVMMIAALEAIFEGDDEREGNPEATFLWICDSPELNEQTKQKFLECSSVFTSGRLITIDAAFDKRSMEPGKIYFINTQKFSKTSNLTKPTSDMRRYSIWQTIANTIAERGKNFVLVLDEAHKGLLAGSTTERREAQTIPRKFLFGEEGKIPPVPLVMGISATPKRFNDILEQSERTAHRVLVDAAVVRRSGLLKHRLLIHNPASRNKHADDTVLREALGHHVTMKSSWQRYCDDKSEPLVRPLLVIQVEDGNDDLFSKTDLDAIIKTVFEVMPKIDPSAIAHCFQEESPVKANGIKIRKVEPSKLQAGDGMFPAEIVLFKTALTTGWDCPRAETMVSYRTANDSTMIEQLIGRMVRAPLARSIETDDTLNSVRLYLPGFDRAAVQKIIVKLSDPGSEEQIATDAEFLDNYVRYDRRETAATIFQAFPRLPSFKIYRSNQQPAVVRLLKLANRLSVSTKIKPSARVDIQRELIAQLTAEAKHRRATDTSFDAAIENAAQVRLETHVFDLLSNGLGGLSNHTVQASAESIDELLQHSSRSLSGDDALGQAYWKQHDNEADAYRAKLEFSVLASTPDVRRDLNYWASSRFDTLYAENKSAIFALPAIKRREIERLAGGQDAPLETVFEFLETIEVEKGPIALSDHIFCDRGQHFHPSPELNSWESRSIEDEATEGRFIGWFRNPSQGDDCIIVPYKDPNGTWHGKSPDFVVFREDSDGVMKCSLIEPHDIERDNSWCIAKGFAEFAEKFAATFERVELTCERKSLLKKLDLCKPSIRKSVLAIHSNSELTQLFDKH
ncbi:DEAD/DEAH box helicase family protein [Agrobacterium sp. SOY23]|uniref:DEAD/DEAH box helicase family protein n=1 Tax=Agrobacterium sp. SOY23 TaxID=3014555 RepID=UPI0022B04507|nr:DEAD/DEAH box helicase family protein [Agrobacterium sp. SOY23]MCZ4433173.1 DEAD/DEAH box helicase family protein [Agrobacterium sp. SOY23]